MVFLATANVLEAIPGPLLDRMELVTLDGYTEDEKVVIARDHLLPRQLERAGLEPSDVEFTDVALRKIAAEYTREAGVRQLERGLARVLRKVAGQARLRRPSAPVHVDADALRRLPGPAEVHAGVGRAHGRAGRRHRARGHRRGRRRALRRGDGDGDGDPGLTLTGQLGDVMKESARSRCPTCARTGLAGDAGRRRKLHIHVPAGAVPKDGPSAGITMTTALASLALGRPVRSDVGDDRRGLAAGRVLPIGGVKQKLLAAHRAGLTDVIIPKRNEPDLDDLPESVRRELRVHPVADVSEVLELALEPVPSLTRRGLTRSPNGWSCHGRDHPFGISGPDNPSGAVGDSISCRRRGEPDMAATRTWRACDRRSPGR